MVNLKIRFIIKTIPAVFGILQHFNQTTKYYSYAVKPLAGGFKSTPNFFEQNGSRLHPSTYYLKEVPNL
ncbi:hypothetical protein SAMN05444380_11230 [Thermophagus xiamenensis]|uniref:Uncharacterized protein n=1 Tax=Thermophagus xiamenensis TaxID=385682 RepID=A0A1I2B018_9BACT|nr:hypothetical protein SAMN05444380_11230 [Thermophagus xiamenensis]